MIGQVVDNYAKLKGIENYDAIEGIWRYNEWNTPLSTKNHEYMVLKELNIITVLRDTSDINGLKVNVKSENKLTDYSDTFDYSNIAGNSYQLKSTIFDIHHTKVEMLLSAPFAINITSGFLKYLLIRPC